MTYFPRLLAPGRDHYFLLGPRGTGKTLWCRHQYPDALRIDLLNPVVLRQYSAQPEYLKDVLAANADKKHVVIDGIQKLPVLLEMVHLLGGRAVRRHMHPYLAVELGARFKLATALRQGMLPVVWAADDPLAVLEAYNALYLHEEVQMEGLVRNIGAFARFLQAMSFTHGSVLNLTNVARESQVSRKTVEGYLEILEDLLLGFRLPVFTRRARRQLASHPKFYFFDAGVFRANRRTGPLDSTGEIDGAALEGLVAQHLHAWCDYSRGKHELHYWQTRSRAEVDFVVYGESGLYAVEVKNSKRVQPADLTALKSFAEDYPQCRRYLLYRGDDRIKRDGVTCLPCEDFLLALKPDRFPE